MYEGLDSLHADNPSAEKRDTCLRNKIFFKTRVLHLSFFYDLVRYLLLLRRVFADFASLDASVSDRRLQSETPSDGRCCSQ